MIGYLLPNSFEDDDYYTYFIHKMDSAVKG